MEERGNVRLNVLALAALMLLAFSLRAWQSDGPLGGFHSFNEGWYSIIASKYTSPRSFLFPTTVYGTVDYNVSPLLTYVLYAMTSLFGWSEAVLRLGPILFSVATLPVLYALGGRFFGRRAGFAAAAFYAFIPVSVVVGRNVQTDALYVFFTMLSLLLYLKGYDEGRRKAVWMFAAGLAFGAGFLSKQFTALLLPAVFLWEIGRHRGVRWFGRGQLAFGAGALLVPGPFFFYHLIYHASQMGRAQQGLSASQFEWLSLSTLSYIGTEFYWGLSPALVALAAPAAFYFLFRRREGASLAMLAIAVFVLFFLHWHGHSYYMLFMAPFVCLLAGGAAQAIRRKWVSGALTVLLVAVAAVQSVAYLCVVKYGYDDFLSLSLFLAEQKKPVVLATDLLAGNYYPALRFYNRNTDILKEKDLSAIGKDRIDFGADRHVFIVGLAGDDDVRMPCMRVYIMRRLYGLFLFGYYIIPKVTSEHFFNVEKVFVKKAGGFRDTGVRQIGEERSLVIGVMRPGEPLPMRNGWIATGCRAEKTGLRIK